jgi:hypothetical protein
MSGFDKARLGHKLENLGWYETENFRYVPPENLFDGVTRQEFSVYDAEALQDLLGEIVTDD